MRDRNCAVRKSIPPPIATDVDDAGEVPGVAPISDDGSVDSLLFSCASGSEGDIWGNNNYDDDASNAHEDFNGNEGAQPTPNILKLLRELIKGLVGRQKSIPQPCGVVVLMAKWSTYH